MGFEIVAGDRAGPTQALQPGRTYSWEKLGEIFEFPDYLGRAGGMVSRPQLNSLLLITHSADGRSFSYGDRWDGDELIYAGRGLVGDQELKGQNLQVAENLRERSGVSTPGRAPASTKRDKTGAYTDFV